MSNAPIDASTAATTNPPSNAVLYTAILDAKTDSVDGFITVPLTESLLSAEFTRHGQDLVIHQNSEDAVLITHYFTSAETPALQSAHGKRIHGDTVERLAGSVAPAQYAGKIPESESIGSVERMEGIVKVTRGDGTSDTLEQGDPIYRNDIIQTDDGSMIGIEFMDGSVFTLGNDARMTIDSMIFDPVSGEGESSFGVIKGMFRFVSGEIAANNPGDMEIRTPVATLGIRGTTGGGQVMGENLDNHFFLEPNADGTIGWIDIKTDAGIQPINQPNAVVEVHSFEQAPPPPTYVPASELQAQFGSVMAFSSNGKYTDRLIEEMRVQPEGEPAFEHLNDSPPVETEGTPAPGAVASPAPVVDDANVQSMVSDEEAVIPEKADSEKALPIKADDFGREKEVTGFEDTATSQADNALAAENQTNSIETGRITSAEKGQFFSKLLNRLDKEKAENTEDIALNKPRDTDDYAAQKAADHARAVDSKAGGSITLAEDGELEFSEIVTSSVASSPIAVASDDGATADRTTSASVNASEPMKIAGLPADGAVYHEDDFLADGHIKLGSGLSVLGDNSLQNGDELFIDLIGGELGMYLALDTPGGSGQLAIQGDNLTLYYFDGTSNKVLGTLSNVMDTTSSSLNILLAAGLSNAEIELILKGLELHYDEDHPAGSTIELDVGFSRAGVDVLDSSFQFSVLDNSDMITLTAGTDALITGSSDDMVHVTSLTDLDATDSMMLGAGMDSVTLAQAGNYSSAQFGGMGGVDAIKGTHGMGATSITVSQAMVNQSDGGSLLIDAADNNFTVDTSAVSSGFVIVQSEPGGSIMLSNLGNTVFTSDYGAQNHVIGGSGADYIYGGAADDNIEAGAGNDMIYGDFGADTLRGGAGDDYLYGGDGNDLMIITEWNQFDLYDGGLEDNALNGDRLFIDPTYGGTVIDFTDITSATGPNILDIEVFDISGRNALTLDNLSPEAIAMITNGSNELIIHATDTGNANVINAATGGITWDKMADSLDLMGDGHSYSTYTGTDGTNNIIVHIDESIGTLNGLPASV